MTTEELKIEVAKYRWWHTIDLGHGIITPGEKACGPTPEPYLNFPERFDGKRVLDCGCWDGAYSFLAEERGAREVIALDSWEFTGKDFGGLHPRHETFDLARRARGSNVIGVWGMIEDASDKESPFDTILCFGVIYHSKWPLLILEKLRSVCAPGGMLILETHTDMDDYPRPACAFYEGAELNSDPTNWWGPNIQCVLAWLRAAGFARAEHVGQHGTRGAFHAFV